jgi:hypothetical protein
MLIFRGGERIENERAHFLLGERSRESEGKNERACMRGREDGPYICSLGGPSWLYWLASCSIGVSEFRPMR